MSYYDYDPNQLPTIDFVGGAEQALNFHIYMDDNQTPFDLSNYSAEFAVKPYADVEGQDVLRKTMGVNNSIVSVTLLPSDTVAWQGKYYYQICIKSNLSGGKTYIPSQGILYVTRNINPEYITS